MMSAYIQSPKTTWCWDYGMLYIGNKFFRHTICMTILWVSRLEKAVIFAWLVTECLYVFDHWCILPGDQTSFTMSDSLDNNCNWCTLFCNLFHSGLADVLLPVSEALFLIISYYHENFLYLILSSQFDKTHSTDWKKCY